jgi:hypothetical protein
MSDDFVAHHELMHTYYTDGGDDTWNGIKFVINPQEGEFDGIVVFQADRPLSRTYTLRCPAGRTLLVVQEPPEVVLPLTYVRQFDGKLGFPGLFWFVQISGREALQRKEWPKHKLISAIVSNQQITSGHRRRLKLMHALEAHFGDRLDWFGRDIRKLEQKADGLLDYHYHIVLENGSYPNYWTEKLSDAFVSNCFPFYWGAPNISDYFDLKSMRIIDVDDVAGTIRTIEETIENDEYSHAQNALACSRRRVLIDYHPYQACLDALSSMPRGPLRDIAILLSNQFRHSLHHRIREKFARVAKRIRRSTTTKIIR